MLLIKKYFANRLWRLNNLYKIINKQDKLITLKLNKAQLKHYYIKHPKTITLKSRQQGISTYKVIEGLDKCIWRPHTQAGIQSYGIVESHKLYAKALVAWNNLDQDIKDLLDLNLVTANQNGLTFSNGSQLRIGNFRGDTLSFLHISELAKIANKFPEKARELKTGAFQAVSLQSNISIESTAEGASGLFYDIVMHSQALQEAGAQLTPLDFELIFLSWMEDPDCYMEQSPYIVNNKKHIVKELVNNYFPKLENQQNIVLSQGQKNWYIAKTIELGEDMKQEYPATIEEAFEQSVSGTILKTEYNSLIADNRIGNFPHIPGEPVTASYDIGVNDETIIHFAQIIKGRPRLINTIVGRKQGIDYYASLMVALVKEQKYRLVDVILPHDANVMDFSTGRTRLERFRDHNLPVRVVKKASILDGIEALKQLINVLYINVTTTDKTVEAIQLYRWKYEAKLDITLPIPQHDWTSNFMDSLRYMAQGLSYTSTQDSTYSAINTPLYSDYTGL